jgi:hypothetical protein
MEESEPEYFYLLLGWQLFDKFNNLLITKRYYGHPSP